MTATLLNIVRKASSGIGTIIQLKNGKNKISGEEYIKLNQISKQSFSHAMQDGFFILMLLLIALTLSSFRINSKEKIIANETLIAAET